MRVALISDIHGNLVSFDAVLADIDRQRVDQVVCLGDVAALGAQPREVLARLRALGCPCVRGNHDVDLLCPDRVQALHPWLVAMTLWCVEQLSAADLEYVRSFVSLVDVPLGDGIHLFCYHGSPRSSEDRILSTTPACELDEMLAGHAAAVMAGGHSHVQMLRRHRDIYVVDVGSVGMPLEQFPFQGMPRHLPWAEYAIVGWTEGVLHLDLRRVPIDLDAIRRAAQDSDMPGMEWWLRCWQGLAL
jgi:predicted phosphodiesterase